MLHTFLMRKTPSPILRTTMLAVLLPVLLLLPTFHTHPDHRHTHGHASTHGHSAVIHADFFAISVHNAHDAHDQGHGVPTENSSQTDFRISLFTLLPRSLVLLTPAPECASLAFLTTFLVIIPLSVIQSRLHSSNHPPPVQSVSFPAISPRSPPHLV